MSDRRSRRPNGERQRGAALVEAALVTPIFALLIFGIIEFGLLFRSYLTTVTASAEAARAASVASGGPTADYLIVQSAAHGLAAQGTDKLVRMVVFDASGPDDQVPTACLSGSVDDLCNHYTATAFSLEYLEDDGSRTPHWGCGASAVDESFCPMDRDTSSDDPGYVGIYLETRHQYATGFIASEQVISDTSVVRIEPGRPRQDLE